MNVGMNSAAVMGENYRFEECIIIWELVLVLLITDVTIYVDQCRYSEGNGLSTGHDTACLSWNLKVHYRVQNTQDDLYHVVAVTETSVILPLTSASRFHYAVW